MVQFFNGLSEPFITKYTQIVDEKLDNLINRGYPIFHLSISQINHLVMSIRTRIRRFKWDHNGNIFNHLVSQWLIQNLPVHEKISSFEVFSKSLAFYKPYNMTFEIYENYMHNFYKAALSVWLQLKEPSLDEVQLAVLEMVAKAINMNMKLERETFAQALYDILLVLINKKNEIITEENFVKLMRNYLGILWKDQPTYYKACSEYYEFAKHFILIDFPNKKHSYFKNFHAIIQGKIAYFNDHLLTILEKYFHKIYEKVVHNKKEISDEDLFEIEENFNEKQSSCQLDFQNYLSQLIRANSNFTRTKVLLGKVFKISEILSFKYWQEMRKYQIVNIFDKTLEKLKVYDFFKYALEKNKILYYESLLPSCEKGQIYIIALRDSIYVKFENFKNLDIKSLLNTLKNQIEFLRESMLIFYEGLIEMKFNKFSIETVYHKIKADIIMVYKEINKCSLDEEQTDENKSMSLYQNALNCFQKKKENNEIKKKNSNKELKELEEIQEESKELIKEEEN